MSPSTFIVHNARIYTADERRPTATAFVVRNERFLRVGAEASILERFPNAPRIDARETTIVPGFIDAHAHLHELGRTLRRVDLRGTSSPEAVIERLISFAREHDLPPTAWLRGHGWDQTDWSPPRFPTRDVLDDAFPERPVWLTRTDVHAGWANTAALDATIGLDRLHHMNEPEGGHIHRDDAGRPTGVLVDRAMALVEDRIPSPTSAQQDRALHTALEHTVRHGVTGLGDAGVGLDDIRRFRRFIAEGSFPIRVHAMINGRGDTFDHFCERGPYHDPSGRLQVASTKFFADGALGSRGAALLGDYTDDPGNRGLLRLSADAFRRTVQKAADCGFQVSTHAIGDRANRFVLDAYEAAMTNGSAPVRPRIEHAQVLAPEDLSRFGALDIIASVQPAHAASDQGWAAARLGPDRLDGAYAWNRLRKTGARLAFGSDAPVEPLDPLRGFHAAVTPQSAAGPSDDTPLSEPLSRAAALRAYTLNAAYAALQEDETGSISPGKRADWVILSKDIMSIPPNEILKTKTLATYLDGRCVHSVIDWLDP